MSALVRKDYGQLIFEGLIIQSINNKKSFLVLV